MAPTLDIPDQEDFERTKKYLELHNVNYNIPSLKNKTSTKQIAELDRSNWIVVPEKEGKKFKAISGYSFDVSPARLAYSPAVKKVGKKLNRILPKEFEINYKNTSKDSLGREFVGNNKWKPSMMLPQFLGVKATEMKEELDYFHLLYLGSQNKMKVYDVSGKQVKDKLCEKLLMDSIKVQFPGRANWIDADYKTGDKDLEVHSNHIFDEQGNIINYKSEVLDEDTLRESKQIDIIDYITKNHTSQGHVSEKVKEGNFYFYPPLNDNNSVARFGANDVGAYLDCYWYPSFRNANLGVRAAELRE